MISFNNIVFMFHFISTSIMVGVIWIIQLVHYPTFLYIDKQKYFNFQKFHMSKVSYLVMPTMTVELISGIYMLLDSENLIENNLFLLAFSFLILNWVITGLVFVKIHNSLLIEYKMQTILLLVKLNWIRTILWSLRLIFLTVIIFLFNMG